MDYFEYRFSIEPFEQGADLVISLLEDTTFESFLTENNVLLAYVPFSNDAEDKVKEILKHEISSDFLINYSKQLIPGKNWNAEWESSFNPIEVNEKCIIRAPFHKEDNRFPLNIIISPQMSFGTGHHETTFLMAGQLFNEELESKAILDMGCGTGVLGIIAAKLGAAHITAIDIESGAVDNTLENCKLNDVCGIHVEKGGAEVIKEKKFQLILANINKNVLKSDVLHYSNSLISGGVLLVSGFFLLDIPEIKVHFEKQGLTYFSEQSRNDWAMLRFTK